MQSTHWLGQRWLSCYWISWFKQQCVSWQFLFDLVGFQISMCSLCESYEHNILGLDLSRFPFFVLRYELTLGERTLDPILRVIAWSLNAPELEHSIWFCPTKIMLTSTARFPPKSSPVKWKTMWHIVWTDLHQVGYIGMWPTVGPNGEPWNRRRGKFPESFALVECRGDWKWHLELWGLKRNYKAINLCHRCVASTRAGPNQ